MDKNKYYAIRTSMLFEKTVLVPVDSVKDINEAIDIVDCAVETVSIIILNEDPECETKPSPYAGEDGIYELTDEEAELYDIIEGDNQCCE